MSEGRAPVALCGRPAEECAWVSDWIARIGSGPDAAECLRLLGREWSLVSESDNAFVLARSSAESGGNERGRRSRELVSVGHAASISTDGLWHRIMGHEHGGGGQFAAASIPKGADSLSLARDPAGAMRVYVHRVAPFTASPSLQSLLRVIPNPGFDRESLALFLEHLSIPAPLSPYVNVQQLLPGEIRTVAYHDRSLIQTTRVHPRRNPIFDDSSDDALRIRGEDAVQALERGLVESVAGTLRGTPHSTLLLSGGKDSSAILLAANMAGARNIDCLTFGFPGRSTDESSTAVQLATDLGYRCEVIPVSVASMRRVFRENLANTEVPLGDPSALATLGLDVTPICGGQLLEGTGNDSLFGIPSPMRMRAVDRVRRIVGCPSWLHFDRANARLRRYCRPAHRMFLSWDGVLWGRDCMAGVNTDAGWQRVFGIVTGRSFIAHRTDVVCLLWEPTGPYLKGLETSRVVQMPVAFPWLETALSDTIARLQRSELFDGAINKVVLRRWLKRVAPAYVTEKPKGAFVVPFEEILGEAVQELLRLPASKLEVVGILGSEVRTIWENWSAGHAELSIAAYGIAVLEHWLRKHIR